jgi:hypothetical protein
MLIDGVMLLWFILTALSVLFVAIDIRTTFEHPVMKWAFTLFTFLFGSVRRLSLRARLPRAAAGAARALHFGPVAPGARLDHALRRRRWHWHSRRRGNRRRSRAPMIVDAALEYVLGFAVGWTIFQALSFVTAMAASTLSRSSAPSCQNFYP